MAKATVVMTAVGALAAAALGAAAASPQSAQAAYRPTPQSVAPEVRYDGGWMVADAEFAPAAALAPAVTYDQRSVPVGARVRMAELTHGHGTVVQLSVDGVAPHRTYGAHVHTRPCGPSPEDAGPHYQNIEDVHQPSSNPVYANPENEVWLDFTTDAYSLGRGKAVQNWHFRAGEANSVVLHEHATRVGSGEAGTAGARLACFTVPFESVTGAY